MSGVFSKMQEGVDIEIMKQMESLGMTFDIDALDIENSYNNSSNNNNSNNDPYLKNRISLEEVRDLPDESRDVDALEKLFMKSYEESSMYEDILFDRWKDGEFGDEEMNEDDYDEGDFDEPCYYDNNNEIYCLDAVAAYDPNDEPRPVGSSVNEAVLDKYLLPMSISKETITVDKKTNHILKYRAFHTPFATISRCNPNTCPYGGKCIDKSTFEEVYDMKVDFWGDVDKEAPSRDTKRKLILKILTKSFRQYNKTFEFIIGSKEKDNRLVCEAAFLIALGLSNNSNASQAPSQWRNTKKYVMEGNHLDPNKPYTYSEITNSGKLKQETYKTKFEHARTFIRNYALTYGDTIPDENGGPETRIVPFYHLKNFFEEYREDSAFRNYLAEFVASKTVFTEAYYDLYEKEHLRKLKSKGAFNTCEICNNAELIRNNKHRKLNLEQRDLIKRFETLHLNQQAAERRFLDDRKVRAAEMDGIRPKRALLFPDGMTEYSCLTPRFQTNSKGDQKVESRFIGIEVYCGPIKTVFIYRTDALIFHGADIMIEVIRQAMIDLCKLLRNRSLLTPRELWLQFDNSGENKNKEMFAYLSLLVEDSYFDLVEIAFLIVGHTHASIDQYFSMISKAIHSKATVFIGSPLSLMQLVRQCHYSKYDQDPVIRDISVYFDMITALQPYVNEKITYYRIPYYFLIKPVFLRVAAIQHKMFSGNTQLLPLPSDLTLTSEDQLQKLLIDTVSLPSSFPLFNGEGSVRNHFGIDTSKKNGAVKSDAFGNINKSRELHAINQALPDLQRISADSVIQQEIRMEDEARGNAVKQYYDIRKLVQKKLVESSDNEKGYMLWLKLDSKVRDQAFSKWSDIIKPKPFTPIDILNNLSTLANEVTGADHDNELNIDEVEPKSIVLEEISDDNNFSVDFEKQSYHRLQENNLHNNNNEDPNAINQSSSVQVPLDARNKRVFKGAARLSAACKWVLSQKESTKITVSDKWSFDDMADILFKAPVLSALEYKWYCDRDTAKKVIEISVKEYKDAAPWEPLPIQALTSEDLQRIEEEKKKVQDSIDEAQKIANDLMTRIGDDSNDLDQVVLYGPNAGAEYIKVVAKHHARGTKSGTTTKSTPSILLYKCDIKDCEKVSRDKEDRCITTGCRSGLRYCSNHLEHSIHSVLPKRSKREKIDIRNIVSQNNNNNNNKVAEDVSSSINKTNNDDKIDNNNNAYNNDNNDNIINSSNNSSSKNSSSNSITSNINCQLTQTQKTVHVAAIDSTNTTDTAISSSNTINNCQAPEASADTLNYLQSSATQLVSKRNIEDIIENSNIENNQHRRKKIKKNAEDDGSKGDLNTTNNIEIGFSPSPIPSLENSIKLLHSSADNSNSEIDISLLANHYFKGQGVVTNAESKYKLFNRIRQSIISEKAKAISKQNIIGRLETELNFNCYIEDLKYLISNVYNIDKSLKLNFDWKTNSDILKKGSYRTQFVSEFAKVFNETYCNCS